MRNKRHIGNLDTCIIVVDYNPQINDNVVIRCFKDKNEARANGFTNPNYLNKHAISIKSIIDAIEYGETYVY